MKERITITLDKEILKWTDKKVKEHTFANRSHCFEFLIANAKKDEQREQEEELEE